jgi:hypothetical protein
MRSVSQPSPPVALTGSDWVAVGCIALLFTGLFFLIRGVKHKPNPTHFNPFKQVNEMNKNEIISLIEAISLKSNDKNTRDDLNNIKSDVLNGKIADFDIEYLRALAQRLGVDINNRSNQQRDFSRSESKSRDDEEDKAAPLRQELARAYRRIAELEAIVREYEKDIPRASVQDYDVGAFAEVKKAFAKFYHPNALTCDGIEKMVRSEIFKEFWSEIQRIERKQKST